MQALVTFDVTDDRRRYRMTQVLQDYGQRVQESVFWIDCDDELYVRMRERLARVVDRALDNVWLLPVCAGCAKRVDVMGVGRKPEVPEYYIL